MKTFYVDIYFLINFTVDILALHFASILSKVPIKPFRMIIATILLSILACGKAVLFDNGFLVDFISFVLCALIVVLSLKGISFARRIRMFFLFIIINFLIGGIVSFLYDKLKDVINPEDINGEINRTLLYFAIIILLVFGIIKLFLWGFSSKLSEKSASVRIELLGRSVVVDCLVDTGNLIVDPIDSTPVLLIKKNKWRELVGDDAPDITHIREGELSKYIRIIPIKRENGVEIAYGLRADSAYIKRGKKEEKIKITFVMDKYEGSFGGYYGLLPASVLEGI